MTGSTNPRFLAFSLATGEARQTGSNVLVLSDSDGTLVDIEANPEIMRPHAKAVKALADLAAMHRVTTAIISSRPGNFLWTTYAESGDRVGANLRNILFYASNGRQQIEHGVVHTDLSIEPLVPVVQGLRERAERELTPLGYRIEDKGITFAIHWREVTERSPSKESEFASTATNWAREAANKLDLQLETGNKMVVEIAPRGSVPFNKGRIAGELVLTTKSKFVIALGDDRGDLPLFEELDKLVKSADIRLLKVVVDSPELPDELRVHAEQGVLANNPLDAADMLAQFARSLDLRRGWGQSR